MTFEEYYEPLLTLYDIDAVKLKDILSNIDNKPNIDQSFERASENLHTLFISPEKVSRVRIIAYLYRLYKYNLVIPLATAIFYYNGRLAYGTDKDKWSSLLYTLSLDDDNSVVMSTNDLVRDIVFNTSIPIVEFYDFIEVALSMYYYYNMTGVIDHEKWRLFSRKYSNLALLTDSIPKAANRIYKQLAILADDKFDESRIANFNPHELELLDRLWRLATAQDKVDLISGEITLSQLITKTSKLYNATKS